MRCNATIEGKSAHGRALLETDDLVFRGDVRLSIAFRDITSLSANEGILTVGYAGRTADFDLGAYAEQWADKIRHPRSIVDKLGVRPGHIVTLIDIADAEFRARLIDRDVVLREGEPRSECDVIFLGVETTDALRKLPALIGYLSAGGAIWTIRPRRHARVTESAVMSAGRSAGLVDTKVVRFSETHTAEKFVVPRARR